MASELRMRSVPLVLIGVLLAGCGPAPDDSVESLMADHERLAVLRSRCKLDHARVGEALCTRVAEATRRRFLQRQPAASD
jgi:hypothetical protein